MRREDLARHRSRVPDRRFTAQQLERYRLRRHVNTIGDVGWDVLVAGQVLGRVYPVDVLPGEPILRNARWTAVVPPDFIWPIHNIGAGRAAGSKAQAVAELFRKLHLEPRDGMPIWAR
jgi:hypothetical protein